MFAVLVAAVAITGPLFPNYMYSPGDLHKLHDEKISDCSACHEPFQRPSGKKCKSSGCHDMAFWNAKKGVFIEHLETENCLKCHTEHAGSGGPIARIAPHKTVTRGVKCLNCHKMGPGHALAFDASCGLCHMMRDWKVAHYNHDDVDPRDDCTICHPLPERHFKTMVRCINCHSFTMWKSEKFNHREAKGQRCASCHKAGPGHYATSKDCGKCHNVSKWISVELAHSFHIQHGSRLLDNDCRVCHPDTLDEFNCYTGCHVHSSKTVLQAHLDRNLTKFLTVCSDCHGAGKEHEAKIGVPAGSQPLQDVFLRMFE